jgi:molybdopterin-containing oxidoreductase family membrane subunit
MIVSVGMWLERYVIIVLSLQREFLPSSWAQYYPTVWDWSLYLGTFGLFFTLLFLFIRVLPMINIFEIRMFLHQETERAHRNASAHSHDDDHGHAPSPASAD